MLALGYVNLLSYFVNNTEQLDKIKTMEIKQEDKDKNNVKYGIQIEYSSGGNEYISFVIGKRNILYNIINCELWMFIFIDSDGGIYADTYITQDIKFQFFKNTIKLTLEYKEHKTLINYKRIITWKNKTII